MDFGFSGEIFFIMLLALILFGPKKLPELARTWGKFMAEFKRASNEFQGQIHDEIRKLELEEADPVNTWNRRSPKSPAMRTSLYRAPSTA